MKLVFASFCGIFGMIEMQDEVRARKNPVYGPGPSLPLLECY